MKPSPPEGTQAEEAKRKVANDNESVARKAKPFAFSPPQRVERVRRDGDRTGSDEQRSEERNMKKQSKESTRTKK